MCAETLTWHHIDMFTIDESTDRLWAFLSEKIAKRSKAIALACCDFWEYRRLIISQFRRQCVAASSPQPLKHDANQSHNELFSPFLNRLGIDGYAWCAFGTLHIGYWSCFSQKQHWRNKNVFVAQRLQDYNAQNDIEIPCKYFRRSPLNEKLFLLSSSYSLSQAWNLCCSYRISGGSASSFYLLPTLRDFMPREEKH